MLQKEKARRKAKALGSTELMCKRFGIVLSLKDRYAQPQEEMQPNQTMMHHCLARRKYADYSIYANKKPLSQSIPLQKRRALLFKTHQNATKFKPIK